MVLKIILFGYCLPTALAALILPIAHRQKPDFFFILCMAAISPITIPLVGGLMIAMTLLPVGLLFGLACLVSPWDLTPIAAYYIIGGSYLCGFAFQLTLFVE